MDGSFSLNPVVELRRLFESLPSAVRRPIELVVFGGDLPRADVSRMRWMAAELRAEAAAMNEHAEDAKKILEQEDSLGALADRVREILHLHHEGAARLREEALALADQAHGAANDAEKTLCVMFAFGVELAWRIISTLAAAAAAGPAGEVAAAPVVESMLIEGRGRIALMRAGLEQAYKAGAAKTAARVSALGPHRFVLAVGTAAALPAGVDFGVQIAQVESGDRTPTVRGPNGENPRGIDLKSVEAAAVSGAGGAVGGIAAGKLAPKLLPRLETNRSALGLVQGVVGAVSGLGAAALVTGWPEHFEDVLASLLSGGFAGVVDVHRGAHPDLGSPFAEVIDGGGAYVPPDPSTVSLSKDAVLRLAGAPQGAKSLTPAPVDSTGGTTPQVATSAVPGHATDAGASQPGPNLVSSGPPGATGDGQHQPDEAGDLARRLADSGSGEQAQAPDDRTDGGADADGQPDEPHSLARQSDRPAADQAGDREPGVDVPAGGDETSGGGTRTGADVPGGRGAAPTGDLAQADDDVRDGARAHGSDGARGSGGAFGGDGHDGGGAQAGDAGNAQTGDSGHTGGGGGVQSGDGRAGGGAGGTASGAVLSSADGGHSGSEPRQSAAHGGDHARAVGGARSARAPGGDSVAGHEPAVVRPGRGPGKLDPPVQVGTASGRHGAGPEGPARITAPKYADVPPVHEPPAVEQSEDAVPADVRPSAHDGPDRPAGELVQELAGLPSADPATKQDLTAEQQTRFKAAAKKALALYRLRQQELAGESWEQRRHAMEHGDRAESLLRYIDAMREGTGKTPRWNQLEAFLLGEHGFMRQMGTGQGKSMVGALDTLWQLSRGEPVESASGESVRVHHVITTTEVLANEGVREFAPMLRSLGYEVARWDPHDPPGEPDRPTVYYMTYDERATAELFDRPPPGKTATIDEADAVLVHNQTVHYQSEGQREIASDVEAAGVYRVRDFMKALLRSRITAAKDLSVQLEQALHDGPLTAEEAGAVRALSPDEVGAARTLTARSLREQPEQCLDTASRLWESYAGREFTAEETEMARAFLDVKAGRLKLNRDFQIFGHDAEKKVQILDEYGKPRSDPKIGTESRWFGGRHKMVEAMFGAPVYSDGTGSKQVTVEDVLAGYEHLHLMSGTLERTAAEIKENFPVEGGLAKVEDFGRSKLAGEEDRIFLTEPDKLRDAVSRVQQLQAEGRPVLVICPFNDLARKFSLMLSKADVEHNAIDARWFAEHRDNNAAEEHLLAVKDTAGVRGAVTVGTGMLGRGFDVSISDEVDQLGGVHAHMLGRSPTNPDEDHQWSARAGRNGRNGSFCFNVAASDRLYSEARQHGARVAVTHYRTALAEHAEATAKYTEAVRQLGETDAARPSEAVQAARTKVAATAADVAAAEREMRSLTSTLQNDAADRMYMERAMRRANQAHAPPTAEAPSPTSSQTTIAPGAMNAEPGTVHVSADAGRSRSDTGHAGADIDRAAMEAVHAGPDAVQPHLRGDRFARLAGWLGIPASVQAAAAVFDTDDTDDPLSRLLERAGVSSAAVEVLNQHLDHAPPAAVLHADALTDEQALNHLTPQRNRLAAELGWEAAQVAGAEGVRQVGAAVDPARVELAALLDVPAAEVNAATARDVLADAVARLLAPTEIAEGPATERLVLAASTYLAVTALLDLAVAIHRRSPKSCVNNGVTMMRVLYPDNEHAYHLPDDMPLRGHDADDTERAFGGAFRAFGSLDEAAESLRDRPGGSQALVYKWMNKGEVESHLVLLVNDSDRAEAPNLVVLDIAAAPGEAPITSADLAARPALLKKAVPFLQWRREQQAFIDRLTEADRRVFAIEFDTNGEPLTRLSATQRSAVAAQDPGPPPPSLWSSRAPPLRRNELALAGHRPPGGDGSSPGSSVPADTHTAPSNLGSGSARPHHEPEFLHAGDLTAERMTGPGLVPEQLLLTQENAVALAEALTERDQAVHRITDRVRELEHALAPLAGASGTVDVVSLAGIRDELNTFLDQRLATYAETAEGQRDQMIATLRDVTAHPRLDERDIRVLAEMIPVKRSKLATSLPGMKDRYAQELLTAARVRLAELDSHRAEVFRVDDAIRSLQRGIQGRLDRAAKVFYDRGSRRTVRGLLDGIDSMRSELSAARRDISVGWQDIPENRLAPLLSEITRGLRSRENVVEAVALAAPRHIAVIVDDALRTVEQSAVNIFAESSMRGFVFRDHDARNVRALEDAIARVRTIVHIPESTPDLYTRVVDRSAERRSDFDAFVDPADTLYLHFTPNIRAIATAGMIRSGAHEEVVNTTAAHSAGVHFIKPGNWQGTENFNMYVGYAGLRRTLSGTVLPDPLGAIVVMPLGAITETTPLRNEAKTTAPDEAHLASDATFRPSNGSPRYAYPLDDAYIIPCYSDLQVSREQRLIIDPDTGERSSRPVAEPIRDAFRRAGYDEAWIERHVIELPERIAADPDTRTLHGAYDRTQRLIRQAQDEIKRRMAEDGKYTDRLVVPLSTEHGRLLETLDLHGTTRRGHHSTSDLAIERLIVTDRHPLGSGAEKPQSASTPWKQGSPQRDSEGPTDQPGSSVVFSSGAAGERLPAAAGQSSDGDAEQRARPRGPDGLIGSRASFDPEGGAERRTAEAGTPGSDGLLDAGELGWLLTEHGVVVGRAAARVLGSDMPGDPDVVELSVPEWLYQRCAAEDWTQDDEQRSVLARGRFRVSVGWPGVGTDVVSHENLAGRSWQPAGGGPKVALPADVYAWTQETQDRAAADRIKDHLLNPACPPLPAEVIAREIDEVTELLRARVPRDQLADPEIRRGIRLAAEGLFANRTLYGHPDIGRANHLHNDAFELPEFGVAAFYHNGMGVAEDLRQIVDNGVLQSADLREIVSAIVADAWSDLVYGGGRRADNPEGYDELRSAQLLHDRALSHGCDASTARMLGFAVNGTGFDERTGFQMISSPAAVEELRQRWGEMTEGEFHTAKRVARWVAAADLQTLSEPDAVVQSIELALEDLMSRRFDPARVFGRVLSERGARVNDVEEALRLVDRYGRLTPEGGHVTVRQAFIDRLRENARFTHPDSGYQPPDEWLPANRDMRRDHAAKLREMADRLASDPVYTPLDAYRDARSHAAEMREKYSGFRWQVVVRPGAHAADSLRLAATGAARLPEAEPSGMSEAVIEAIPRIAEIVRARIGDAPVLVVTSSQDTDGRPRLVAQLDYTRPDATDPDPGMTSEELRRELSDVDCRIDLESAAPLPTGEVWHRLRLDFTRQRILVCCALWGLGESGMATLTVALCQALAEAGHAVTVRAGEVERAPRIRGVQVIGDRDSEPSAVPRERMLSNWDELPESMDLVIVHDAGDGLAAALAAEQRYPTAKLVRVNHLTPMLFHTLHNNPERGRAKLAADVFLARRARLVAGLGPVLAADALSSAVMAGHGSVHDLQPGLVMAEQPPVPAPGSPARILLFGRADDPLKGVAEIARVVRRLRAGGRDARLIVRGYPSRGIESVRAELVRLVGAPDAVEVAPRTSDRAVLQEDIRTATVVVMPSRAEGFGLAAAEAIEQGVPVVVPSSSGVGKFLTELGEYREQAQQFNIVEQQLGAAPEIETWAAALGSVLDDVPAAWAAAGRLQQLLQPFTRRRSAKMLVHAALNTDPHPRRDIRPSRARVTLEDGDVVVRGEGTEYELILDVADAMETDPAVRRAVMGYTVVKFAPSRDPLPIRLAAARVDEWLFDPSATTATWRHGSRASILRAFVATVSAKGFGATTIDDVCRRARISRKAFLDRFLTTDSVLADAHREALSNLNQLVVDEVAAVPASNRAARLTTAVDTYVSALAARPATARLLLVEGFAADPGTRAELGVGMTDEIAATLATVFEESTSAPERRALAAAVHGMLADWAATGDATAVPALRRGLVDLLGNGTTPAVGSADDHPADVLQSSREQRSRSAPEANPDERERILTQLVAVTAEQGYLEMSLETVQRRAGVSPQTYRELFSDKRNGFEAACAAAVERVRIAARAAIPDTVTDDPPARLRAAVHAYLTALAEHPDEARVLHLDLLAPGPVAHRLHDRHRAMLAAHFVDVVDEGDARTARLLASAVAGVVTDRILSGRTRTGSRRSTAGESERIAALPGFAPVVTAAVGSLLPDLAGNMAADSGAPGHQPAGPDRSDDYIGSRPRERVGESDAAGRADPRRVTGEGDRPPGFIGSRPGEQPDPLDASRGAWLKALRLEQGMKQKDVAQAAGLTNSALSNIEKGRRTTLGTFQQVCRALGFEGEALIEAARRFYPDVDFETDVAAHDSLGGWVGAYRNIRGMKKADLARAVGVTLTRIWEVENGDRPPPNLFFRIARALGVGQQALAAAARSFYPELVLDLDPAAHDPASTGTWIMALRHSRNMTQAELARTAGTSAGYIDGIEGGEYTPSSIIFRRICRALEVAPKLLGTATHHFYPELELDLAPRAHNPASPGGWIVAVRHDRDMTRLELAKAIGPGWGHLGKIETGEYVPRFAVFRRICEVLGIDDELLRMATRQFYPHIDLDLEPAAHDLGGWITALRNDRDMTRVELARVTGLSTKYLAQVETEHRRPQFGTFRRICRGLGVSGSLLIQAVRDFYSDITADIDPAAHASLGSWIAALRHDEGMTTTELARRIGLPRRSLSDIENNRYLPRLSKLRHLCQAQSVGGELLLEIVERFYADRFERSGYRDEEELFGRYVVTRVGSSAEREVQDEIRERFAWIPKAVARREDPAIRDEVEQVAWIGMLLAIRNHVPSASFAAHAWASCRGAVLRYRLALRVPDLDDRILRLDAPIGGSDRSGHSVVADPAPARSSTTGFVRKVRAALADMDDAATAERLVMLHLVEGVSFTRTTQLLGLPVDIAADLRAETVARLRRAFARREPTVRTAKEQNRPTPWTTARAQPDQPPIPPVSRGDSGQGEGGTGPGGFIGSRPPEPGESAGRPTPWARLSNSGDAHEGVGGEGEAAATVGAEAVEHPAVSASTSVVEFLLGYVTRRDTFYWCQLNPDSLFADWGWSSDEQLPDDVPRSCIDMVVAAAVAAGALGRAQVPAIYNWDDPEDFAQRWVHELPDLLVPSGRQLLADRATGPRPQRGDVVMWFGAGEAGGPERLMHIAVADGNSDDRADSASVLSFAADCSWLVSQPRRGATKLSGVELTTIADLSSTMLANWSRTVRVEFGPGPWTQPPVIGGELRVPSSRESRAFRPFNKKNWRREFPGLAEWVRGRPDAQRLTATFDEWERAEDAAGAPTRLAELVDAGVSGTRIEEALRSSTVLPIDGHPQVAMRVDLDGKPTGLIVASMGRHGRVLRKLFTERPDLLDTIPRDGGRLRISHTGVRLRSDGEVRSEHLQPDDADPSRKLIPGRLLHEYLRLCSVGALDKPGAKPGKAPKRPSFEQWTAALPRSVFKGPGDTSYTMTSLGHLLTDRAVEEACRPPRADHPGDPHGALAALRRIVLEVPDDVVRPAPTSEQPAPLTERSSEVLDLGVMSARVTVGKDPSGRWRLLTQPYAPEYPGDVLTQWCAQLDAGSRRRLLSLIRGQLNGRVVGSPTSPDAGPSGYIGSRPEDSSDAEPPTGPTPNEGSIASRPSSSTPEPDGRQPIEEDPAVRDEPAMPDPVHATHQELTDWAAQLPDGEVQRFLAEKRAESSAHMAAVHRGRPPAVDVAIGTARAQIALTAEQWRRFTDGSTRPSIADARAAADAATAVFHIVGALPMAATPPSAFTDDPGGLLDLLARFPERLLMTAGVDQATGADAGDWARRADAFLTEHRGGDWDSELIRSLRSLPAKAEQFAHALTGSDRAFGAAAAQYIPDAYRAALYSLTRTRDVEQAVDRLRDVDHAVAAAVDRLGSSRPAADAGLSLLQLRIDIHEAIAYAADAVASAMRASTLLGLEKNPLLPRMVTRLVDDLEVLARHGSEGPRPIRPVYASHRVTSEEPFTDDDYREAIGSNFHPRVLGVHDGQFRTLQGTSFEPLRTGTEGISFVMDRWGRMVGENEHAHIMHVLAAMGDEAAGWGVVFTDEDGRPVGQLHPYALGGLSDPMCTTQLRDVLIRAGFDLTDTNFNNESLGRLWQGELPSLPDLFTMRKWGLLNSIEATFGAYADRFWVRTDSEKITQSPDEVRVPLTLGPLRRAPGHVDVVVHRAGEHIIVRYGDADPGAEPEQVSPVFQAFHERMTRWVSESSGVMFHPDTEEVVATFVQPQDGPGSAHNRPDGNIGSRPSDSPADSDGSPGRSSAVFAPDTPASQVRISLAEALTSLGAATTSVPARLLEVAASLVNYGLAAAGGDSVEVSLASRDDDNGFAVSGMLSGSTVVRARRALESELLGKGFGTFEWRGRTGETDSWSVHLWVTRNSIVHVDSAQLAGLATLFGVDQVNSAVSAAVGRASRRWGGLKYTGALAVEVHGGRLRVRMMGTVPLEGVAYEPPMLFEKTITPPGPDRPGGFIGGRPPQAADAVQTDDSGPEEGDRPSGPIGNRSPERPDDAGPDKARESTPWSRSSTRTGASDPADSTHRPEPSDTTRWSRPTDSPSPEQTTSLEWAGENTRGPDKVAEAPDVKQIQAMQGRPGVTIELLTFEDDTHVLREVYDDVDQAMSEWTKAIIGKVMGAPIAEVRLEPPVYHVLYRDYVAEGALDNPRAVDMLGLFAAITGKTSPFAAAFVRHVNGRSVWQDHHLHRQDIVEIGRLVKSAGEWLAQLAFPGSISRTVLDTQMAAMSALREVAQHAPEHPLWMAGLDDKAQARTRLVAKFELDHPYIELSGLISPHIPENVVREILGKLDDLLGKYRYAPGFRKLMTNIRVLKIDFLVGARASARGLWTKNVETGALSPARTVLTFSLQYASDTESALADSARRRLYGLHPSSAQTYADDVCHEFAHAIDHATHYALSDDLAAVLREAHGKLMRYGLTESYGEWRSHLPSYAFEDSTKTRIHPREAIAVGFADAEINGISVGTPQWVIHEYVTKLRPPEIRPVHVDTYQRDRPGV
ncbi:helix-turn-helix domain-containing protein [Nocardia niwae]|uniref:Helix-turn-helix domain-containing protein n=1 Tax=Nocardia niwae TaxID=626084 RepID=A0ABV2X8Y6_9NOCA